MPTGPTRFTRLWARYGEVLSSADFRFAALTLVLTLLSWGLWLTGAPEGLVALTGIGAALAGGVPIAYGAVRGLLHREVNVDELVTIAVVAAIVVGEYWSAALVTFMMLFGKVLEDVTAARAEHAIEGLGQLVPATARRFDPTTGQEQAVPVAALRVGDVVLVRPGERLPADGQVVSGAAAVEEAAITGEPLPVEKQVGAAVYAGTLAHGGALDIAVTRVGEATAMGRIAALVKEAEAERAPIVRVADRWARWFTPAVLALAAVMYLWQREFLPALTVLVVACPCALVLATPTAFIAGIARGARGGVLIKGGARLEAAGRANAVCLDKTGTLTRGTPVVQSVRLLPGPSGALGVPLPPLDEALVLRYAAAAERRSEHPLARAVVAAAEAQGLSIPPLGQADATFESLPGRGVAALVPALHQSQGHDQNGVPLTEGCSPPAFGLEDEAASVAVLVGRLEFLEERGVAVPTAAESLASEMAEAGQTPLLVAVSGAVVGVLGVSDAVRPEARAAVQALRAAGLTRVVMLTGDRLSAAQAVAQTVGIAPEDVQAGLLPEEKVAHIRRLHAAGYTVAMIGDGVNDAPALAAADVAVALGLAGTDIALAAADIALMTDDLRQAAAAIRLSRRTVHTVNQNLWFAAAWNAVALVLAATGSFGPVAGALVHNVGSVAVVLNAARLVNVRLR